MKIHKKLRHTEEFNSITAASQKCIMSSAYPVSQPKELDNQVFKQYETPVHVFNPRNTVIGHLWNECKNSRVQKSRVVSRNLQ